MATGDDGQKPVLGGTVDWKTLFLGACAVIAVLVGVWNRSLEGDADSIRTTNAKQWERLAELNDRLLGNAAQIEQLKQDRTDHETRLRYLERQAAKFH